MPPTERHRLAAFAKVVMRACRQAAVETHEDALIRGLCAEGAFEAAMGAIEGVDVKPLMNGMGDTKKQPYGKFVVKIKRIHESPVAHDGVRVLVDRLWPRGVSKEAARLDAWHKDIAPSTSLREWFGHDSARWEEFQRRYRRELVAQPACVEALRDLARGGTLTLLYAAKDEAHNNAVVLREFLARREQHGSKRAPRKPA